MGTPSLAYVHMSASDTRICGLITRLLLPFRNTFCAVMKNTALVPPRCQIVNSSNHIKQQMQRTLSAPYVSVYSFRCWDLFK